MPNDKGEVEGFKLTKEQKTWYQDYKQINKVSQMLRDGLQIQYDKTQTLQQLFQQAQGVKAKMLKGAPPNPVNEIEGQQETGR